MKCMADGSSRLLHRVNYWKCLSVLLVVRSAILRGYKYIYGKVVLDVGAGTGDCHLLPVARSTLNKLSLILSIDCRYFMKKT